MSTEEITIDGAETIALKALEFILADKNLQTQFISSSGMSPKDIHASIKKKEFLSGVLNFLTSNEESLVDFCNKHQIESTSPLAACKTLEKTPEPNA